MPSTVENQARSIGFTSPTVHSIRLKRGEKFGYRGVTAEGVRFELRYKIADFTKDKIKLNFDGKYGIGNTIEDVALIFPLVPNKPLLIPKPIDFGQPNLYIAFLAPSASTFKPQLGKPLIIALGEVRDTVPPPPPK